MARHLHSWRVTPIATVLSVDSGRRCRQMRTRWSVWGWCWPLSTTDLTSFG